RALSPSSRTCRKDGAPTATSSARPSGRWRAVTLMAARRSAIGTFGYSLVAPPRHRPSTPDSIKKSTNRSNVAIWKPPFAASGVATAAITPVITDSTSHATRDGQMGATGDSRLATGDSRSRLAALGLLGPERRQRIDPAGPPRGQIAGEERDGEQSDREDTEYHRIARFDLKQERGEKPHGRESHEDARRDPGDGKAHHASDDETKDVTTLRAECHSNA